MTISIDEIPIGSMITFRSKRETDTVVWRGVLEGKVSYLIARGYEDPRSYNEAVRQSEPTIPSDVTLLDYFLVTLDNSAEVKETKAFAQEWIESGTLAIINPGNKVTILVQDPLSNPNQIVSLLASAGYKSKIVN